MKSSILLNTSSGLEELFLKLGPEAKRVCFLNGDESGWRRRLAWNPQDSFILNEPAEMNKLSNFIKNSTKKGNLVAGFLSYDLGFSLHNLNKKTWSQYALPLAVFYSYEDYLEEKNDGIYAIYNNDSYVDNTLKMDRNVVNKSTYRLSLKYGLAWNKKDYNAAFHKIKKHIYEGDIYQINLTQRIQASGDYSPRLEFKRLSDHNPALMKTYFEGDDFEIISMSPERFIRTDGQNIETYPIKGTAAKGETIDEEKENETRLLNNPKEKSELNMITDLLRNDLGKVCKAGSVNVEESRSIERLAEVIHTYSHIKGTLKPGYSPFDALISMFPGGSITGCPKRKAMEIIDGLEHSARGIYCGSMVVIDEKGNLDSNILIRTIIKTSTSSFLSVGGGIVYDSKLENEYQETLDKAKSLIKS